MSFRILRQSTVGLRPTQHYVHEANHPIEFGSFVAAHMWIAKLRKELPEPLRLHVKFEVVRNTKH